MTNIQQDFEITSIEQVTPHPKNPRRSDVGELVASIKANGFYGSVVAQRSTGYILAGNHRVEAALEVGLTEIPVMWIDCSDSQALRILLVDNRSSDTASYDNRGLTEILRELKEDELGLDGTGFDEMALADLERLSGLLSDDRTSWLDKFMRHEGRNPENDILNGDRDGEENRRYSGLDSTSAENFFSVSYMYKIDERTEVVGVLNAVREVEGLETASQALLSICRQWKDSNEGNDK